MNDFTEYIDLAAERFGGAVLFTNDEFFAPKENLLKAAKPVFLEDQYTDQGKWMDGWETRRRRVPGHDWCIIRLGLPGIVRGVVVDTSHFLGNYPEYCSIEACDRAFESEAPICADDFVSELTSWHQIVPKSPLQGDTYNRFPVHVPYRFSHLRLNIFPDGGVARLRVYGEALPDWWQREESTSEIDLAAVEHGGLVVTSNDMFFGSRNNLILPGRAVHMGDGWETRRRRGPGFDWAIVRLATTGVIRRVEVDTSHFKGNYPESCSVEVCAAETSVRECGATENEPLSHWRELLPRTKLQPHHRHLFEEELRDTGPATHARLSIYPDGGVARLRLLGAVTRDGLLDARLRFLNALAPERARKQLHECCGSLRWCFQMIQRRPFKSSVELLERADSVWSSLGREDWLEAFRSHPRIGETPPVGDASSARHSAWSREEQSGACGAPQELLVQLAEANRAYESTFGYIFLACATRKSAEELLAIARERLHHGPEDELHIAAEEQRKITDLRLKKLLGV